jgi:hypothetical protein
LSAKLVPTFADRGVSPGQCSTSPTAVISVLDRTSIEHSHKVLYCLAKTLHGKNIFRIILEISRPPLWSSGQSSWLQIQRSGSVASVRERSIPTERPPFVGERLVPSFEDRGCRVVNAADPYSLILGLMGQSRYFIFQVAPLLYSRG